MSPVLTTIIIISFSVILGIGVVIYGTSLFQLQLQHQVTIEPFVKNTKSLDYNTFNVTVAEVKVLSDYPIDICYEFGCTQTTQHKQQVKLFNHTQTYDFDGTKLLTGNSVHLIYTKYQIICSGIKIISPDGFERILFNKNILEISSNDLPIEYQNQPLKINMQDCGNIIESNTLWYDPYSKIRSLEFNYTSNHTSLKKLFGDNQ